MQYKLFSEFVRNPYLMMDEDHFRAVSAVIMQNMRNGVQLEFEPKVMTKLAVMGGETVECHDTAELTAQMKSMGADGGNERPFMNVICIHGDMSREGGACTYGSKEHKQMIMEAADNPLCHGHVIDVDSGGGQAATLEDYREAFNYCYERGQNVVARISWAASAAYFTSAMSNRIFVERKSTEVGSMGAMAMFPTIKDGTVLPATNQVMHIVYASQSEKKNYAYREAADGNLQPVQDRIDKICAQALANAKQDRPSIKDEQQTGEVYDAEDVMGSMVDQYGTLEDAIAWLEADWQSRHGAALPIKEEAGKATTSRNTKAEETPAPVTDASPSGQHAETENQNTNQPNTATKMYENIASALGLEAIEHTEDGVMLNAPLADQLEAHLQSHADALAAKDKAHADALAQKDKEMADALAAKEQEMTDALAKKDAEIAALQAAAQQQTEQHTTALADATNAHEQAIAQLNAEHQQAIDTLNATLGEKETALTTAQQQLDEANATIQNLEQKVTTLQTEAPAPAAGAAPADNGSEMPQAQTLANAVYQWDNAKSVAENLAAKAAFEAALSAK